MEWTDTGIVLGIRRHGETSVIVELFTPTRGRHAGLVRGGRSKRLRPVLQPGNSVRATWRARLEDHLGTYTIEAETLRASGIMTTPAGLHALNAMTALALQLAEREPHLRLYEGMHAILDHLPDAEGLGYYVLMFELSFLEDLGFGLDLSACAATGTSADLRYVSPKTARAVSGSAGEPYKDRLLHLPTFLREPERNAFPDPEDLAEGYALTGFFLERHVFGARGLPMPDARFRLLRALGAEIG